MSKYEIDTIIKKMKEKINSEQKNLKKWSGHTTDCNDFEDEHDEEIWYMENRGDINYIKGLQEALAIMEEK
jgi:hypothetical protein|tara:strand:+ start:120 stop:332 length:213 start_codon:yes stop_codon:yes gene_type:complete